MLVKISVVLEENLEPTYTYDSNINVKKKNYNFQSLHTRHSHRTTHREAKSLTVTRNSQAARSVEQF